MEKEKSLYQKFLKIEPLLHVLLWSVVLFYPYVKYIGREGGYAMSFIHELNSLFFKMTISYFLYLWFFPKKNKKKYLLIVLLVFLINTFLYDYFDRLFHVGNSHSWKHFVTNMLTYLSFGIVFFAIYSIKDIYIKQIQINELLKEKNEAEIKILKAQINPHFLFNTLNTLYANALKKDDKTPDLILKLSDNFRYLLNEGQKKQVIIQQEVKHIQDYIDLQQERLSKKITVKLSKKIDNSEQKITPLLFIAFIENAFKYTSRMKGDNHPINIEFELKSNKFKFICENPFNYSNQEQEDHEWEESGIGIKNTQKRLELLYPKRHQLIIKKENGIFKVTLDIEI